MLQGDVRVAEQGEAGDAHDVVHPRPPRLGEDVPEDGHEVVDDQVGVVAFEGVEGGRVGLVGVEDDDLVRQPGGDAVEDVEDHVAVRVDDDGAAPGEDVVDGHVDQQRRLPGAGRPDHVRVVAGVDDRQRDRVAADLGVAEDFRAASPGGDRDGGGHGFGAGPVQAGDGEVLRQRGEGGEFGARGEEPGAEPTRGEHRDRLSHAGAVGEPVAAGVDGERGAEGVGDAAQPAVGQLLAGAGAGAGDGVADAGLPQRVGGLVQDRADVAFDSGSRRDAGGRCCDLPPVVPKRPGRKMSTHLLHRCGRG